MHTNNLKQMAIANLKKKQIRRTQLTRALHFFSNFNPFLYFNERKLKKENSNNNKQERKMTVLSTFRKMKNFPRQMLTNKKKEHEINSKFLLMQLTRSTYFMRETLTPEFSFTASFSVRFTQNWHSII